MNDIRVLSAQLPAELANRIEAAAASMARPSDGIVEEALSNWLDYEDWKHQATLEGMEDVRTGRTVSNDRVMAWLESLDIDQPLPCPEP